MGIFDFFTKKKRAHENELKEFFNSLSLKELEDILYEAGEEGTASDILKIVNKKYPEKHFEQKDMYNVSVDIHNAYYDKLVYSPVEEGGFGGDRNAEYPYNGSVIYEGIHGIKNAYGQMRIINHQLEFLRIYIKKGLPTPLKYSRANLIFEIIENKGMDINGVISKDFSFTYKDIENENHPIYNPWVWQGDDSFVEYKIKLAVRIASMRFLSKWGLFRPNGDGTPSDEYITIDDLTAIDDENELKRYIESLQTERL